MGNVLSLARVTPDTCPLRLCRNVPALQILIMARCHRENAVAFDFAEVWSNQRPTASIGDSAGEKGARQGGTRYGDA